MGFDAGAITAHLKLDREEFDEELDEVKADAQEVEDKPIEVKATLDKDEFDAGVEEIDEERDRQEADPIELKVELDGEEAVAEAAATREEVDEALGKDPVITPEIDGAPVIAEAAAVREAVGEELSKPAGPKVPSLIKALLGEGVTQNELPSALKSLGFSPSETRDMVEGLQASIAASLPQGAAAQAIVAGLLPSEAEYQRAMAEGIAGLETGIYDPFASDKKYSSAELGTGKFIWEDMGLSGPPGAGFRDLNGVSGGGPSFAEAVAAAGGGSIDGDVKTAAEEFADKWKQAAANDLRDAQYDIFQGIGGDGSSAVAGLGGAWSTLFMGKGGVEDQLRDWADKAGVDVGDTFIKSMSTAAMQAAEDEAGRGGAGGIFNGLLQKLVGGAGSALSGDIPSVGTLPGLSIFSSIIPALLQGVGIAGAGALAGTSIGLAGTATAVIPGIMDLLKGYDAYKAQQTYNASGGGLANFYALLGSDKGLSAGELSIGGAVGNVVNAIKPPPGISAQIDPQIVKFLNAVASALNGISGFGQTAVTAMSGFFGQIDKALTGGGFSTFVSDMTKDVGPIMDDFGTFILNGASAFSKFLEVFGGAPAQAVGSWFDRVSGDLSSWLGNLHITPGEMQNVSNAFNLLGAALDTVWHAGEKLEPIGAFILPILTNAIQGLTRFIDLIPVPVIAAIGLGLLAWGAATNPIVALALAILGVGEAIQLLDPAKLKPLTDAQLIGAQKAVVGGPGVTDADKVDLQLVDQHGLTNAQLAAAAKAAWRQMWAKPASGQIGPPVPGAPGSPNTPAQYGPLRTAQSSNTNQNAWGGPNSIYGRDIRPAVDDVGGFFKSANTDLTNWTRNFTKTISDFSSDTVPHALDAVRTGISDWITNSLPHAFDNTRNTVAHGLDDITGGVSNFVTNSIPHAFDTIRSAIANFFTESLPHAFVPSGPAVITGLHGITTGVESFLTNTLPHALGSVTSAISSWVTTSVPKAFDGMGRAISGAFSGAGSWLAGVGKSIINGLIGGINSAINFANSHDPSIFGFSLYPKMKDIPTFDNGGWVGGPPGAPQLAIVHGGEFVQSRAMLSNGGAGGHSISISVDARGATDPAATQAAAQAGAMAAIPALRRALNRSSAANLAVAS